MQRASSEISTTQVKLRACRSKARLCKAAGNSQERRDAVDDALWWRRIDILDKIAAADYIDPLTCRPRPRPCT